MKSVEERTGNIHDHTVTLDRIPGMESSKRALEVALAGGHAIVFIFNNTSHAPSLVRVGKRVAENHGLEFHGLAYPVCGCGDYGNRTQGCRCRPITMKRHLGRLARRHEEFDIWVDACSATPTGMQAWPGETEEVMSDRVRSARTIREMTGPDNDGRDLLHAYIKHMGKAMDEDRILGLASTIARLEDMGRSVRPHHVAEAIQYQPTSHEWIWKFTGLEQLEILTERR